MQPPPGGWPTRRANDEILARALKENEQIKEDNRLMKLDLKAALSKHADIENNQDWLGARRKRDIQTLAMLGGLISLGFGWAIYQGGFAKAEALEKTQAKVADQDTHIAKVEQTLNDIQRAQKETNDNIRLLLKQGMETKAPIVVRRTR